MISMHRKGDKFTDLASGQKIDSDVLDTYHLADFATLRKRRSTKLSFSEYFWSHLFEIWHLARTDYVDKSLVNFKIATCKRG